MTDEEWIELLEETKRYIAEMTPAGREEMHWMQRQYWLRALGPYERGMVDFEDCEECREIARK